MTQWSPACAPRSASGGTRIGASFFIRRVSDTLICTTYTECQTPLHTLHIRTYEKHSFTLRGVPTPTENVRGTSSHCVGLGWGAQPRADLHRGVDHGGRGGHAGAEDVRRDAALELRHLLLVPHSRIRCSPKNRAWLKPRTQKTRPEACI